MIRLASATDAADILAIYAPMITDTCITFEYEVPEINAFTKRIEEVLAFAPWLVCEIDGIVAGYAYAGRHRSRSAYQWSVEFSAYVHADYQRRGIALGLYHTLLEILKLQGYYNAYAGIAFPNPKSIAFHEKFGFKPLGVYKHVGYKHGQWHDVGWWEMEISPPASSPVSPKTLAEVQNLTEWQTAIAKGEAFIR